MSRALVLVIACVLASPAWGAMFRAGPWRLPDVPVIVAGDIVAIEDRGERELFLNEARPGHWLYPYAVARVRAVEILKNSTGESLTAGDTMVVWYPTSNSARNYSEPNTLMSSEFVEVRVIAVGQSAAFFLCKLFGEWHFQGEAVEVAVARRALAERARPDSSGSVSPEQTNGR